MKAPKRIPALIAALLLYTSAASASTVADSVNIHGRDGAVLCTSTFEVPEQKGSDAVEKIAASYLDLKHRRFLQKCKSLETDMALIYEAWKAGAAESDSFTKDKSQKAPSVGGKSLQNTGNGYTMTTDLIETPARGTVSLITREVSSIIGQRKAIVYAATFDANTGRRLSLADAFGGNNAIADKIAVYIQHFLPNSNYKDGLSPDFGAHVYDFCSAQVEDGWYIAGDYLIAIYPPGTITNSSTGDAFVSVPLKELMKK
ncbi:MAG: hypothetical protein Q4D07_07665 [Selenomonadaceae bacterium]|nr:hypothetical protein [Selenomonadaceae bacterium]